MSQILFQGNNLVVTGSLGTLYSNVPLADVVEAPEGSHRRTLHLDFIVQMNGKMIVHREAITLCVDMTSTENPTLEEWSSWYTICNLMTSFGYSFSEEKNQMYNAGGIIRDWIDKLIIEESRAVGQGNIVGVQV